MTEGRGNSSASLCYDEITRLTDPVPHRRPEGVGRPALQPPHLQPAAPHCLAAVTAHHAAVQGRTRVKVEPYSGYTFFQG